MSLKKFFPIKTESSCQLKWTWSTIMLHTGKTNSCHRVDGTVLNVDTFDNFHNTEKKLNDRQLMLEGQWPQGGCEYCKNIEDSGGVSDRQFQLTVPNLVPPELETNPTAVNVTPRILEVYLNNVCNMSCIYCWDGFSSKIQQENKKFGPFEKNGISIKNLDQLHPDYDKLVNKFYGWLDNNYEHLHRFHILGGEPFFQTEFEQCLQFLETHSNRELEFNIVSNLKLSLDKLKQFVERIKRLIVDKKIKRFDLTASIDCWGNEQEYIRYGIDLNQWKENFSYLAKQKWITLNINQTITGLGIKSMPGLLEFVNNLRQDRYIGHYFMACVNRSHLYPGIFGSGYFDKDFYNILNLMPTNHWQYEQAKNMMKGLQLEFNSRSRDKTELLKLVTFLDEIDRRRNLNWKETFPWLEKEVSDVVQ